MSEEIKVEGTEEQAGDTPPNEEAPAEETPEVEEEGTKFANLEEASKGLAVILNRLSEVNLPPEVNKALLRHIGKIADVCDTLPSKGTSDTTPEEANKAAFGASPGFIIAKEAAASFGQDLVPGTMFYDKLWAQFKKPYSAENPPSPPTYRLVASFEVKDGTRKAQGPRAANGSNPDATPDRRLKDNAVEGDKGRVYYTTLWEAYKKDGKYRHLLTEAQKGAQFYQGGGLGRQFAVFLEGQKLIGNSRAFLREYEVASSEQWVKDGKEGKRFEEVTD